MRFPDLLSKINRMQDEIDSLKTDLSAIFPEARAYWRREVSRETAQDLNELQRQIAARGTVGFSEEIGDGDDA